jgi:hypothetical protein
MDLKRKYAYSYINAFLLTLVNSISVIFIFPFLREFLEMYHSKEDKPIMKAFFIGVNIVLI